ncbi:ankyrin, partial [Choiromyces venosus 120613-1]
LDPDTKDFKGRTPLGLAAKHGHVEFVKILTAREDLDVNSKNYKSMTPLLLAVKEGREDNNYILRLLLSSPGVDVNLPEESQIENTALHLAIQSNNLEIVQKFLEHNRVDINLPNLRGKIPMDLAVELRRWLIIWLL